MESVTAERIADENEAVVVARAHRVSVRDESLTSSSQTSGATTTGMLMGEVVAVVSSHHETTDDDEDEFYKRHVMGGANSEDPTRSGRFSSSLRSSNVGTSESVPPLRPVFLRQPENHESEQSVSILTEHTSVFVLPPNQGSTEPPTIANDASRTLDPLPNHTAQDPPTPKESTVRRRQSRTLWWTVIGATVLAVGLVSGICGSGHCSGGNGSAQASATSNAIPLPPMSSSEPSLDPLLGTASPQIDPLYEGDNAFAKPDSSKFSHSRTLDAIQAQGALRCGIPDGIELDKIDNGPSLVRFNVDLVRERNCYCGCDKTPPCQILTEFSSQCKAIAAAIFGSAGDHYNLTLVTPSNRFVNLDSGVVDLLVSSTTHTMERHVYEVCDSTRGTKRYLP
jgi:ABC-type amino acid transport substrate-binding protein